MRSTEKYQYILKYANNQGNPLSSIKNHPTITEQSVFLIEHEMFKLTLCGAIRKEARKDEAVYAIAANL
jgi:hypothetical protein